MTGKETTPSKSMAGSGITRRGFIKGAGAGGLAIAGSGLPLFNIAKAAQSDLTYALFGEPAGLNEFLYTEIHGGVVTTNIYNKMARMNFDSLQVEPELVEWKMIDALTWQLKVREGVKWHKGYGELTAEDIEYVFNYIQESNASPKGTAHFMVEGAKAIDKYAVEVKLKTPFSPFPLVTLEYGGNIMCKAAHKEMGDQEYARNPIGTGPFVFEEWVSGSHVILKKNAEYWRPDQPRVEQVIYRVIEDPGVRLSSLLTGEIDIMPRPDPKDVARFREGLEPGIKYQSVAGWNWDYMDFTFPPHIDAAFPTVKADVRRAISYAINRQTIVDEIYGGEALVTDNPLPPGYVGHRDSPVRYPAGGDIEKAKELMARAGVGPFDLEVITSDKEWLRRESELVAAMLSEIGINMTIKSADIGTYSTSWVENKFQADLEDITIVSPDSDSALWWFHHKGGMVEHGWNNDQVSQWLDDARVETDQEKRAGLYHQIVDVILDDCPYIYIAHVNQVFLHKEGVTGFKATPQENNVPLWNVGWA